MAWAWGWSGMRDLRREAYRAEPGTLLMLAIGLRGQGRRAPPPARVALPRSGIGNPHGARPVHPEFLRALASRARGRKPLTRGSRLYCRASGRGFPRRPRFRPPPQPGSTPRHAEPQREAERLGRGDGGALPARPRALVRRFGRRVPGNVPAPGRRGGVSPAESEQAPQLVPRALRPGGRGSRRGAPPPLVRAQGGGR